MKQKIILLIIILTAAVSGFWYFQRADDSKISPNENVSKSNKAENILPKDEKFDPVSLPALMQKEFEGKDLTLGKVLAENESYTRYYITYKSDGLTISGIMNVPKASPPEGGFPVLILNHGYIDVNIYANGRGLRREQDYLARQGFVVIHPDYRNHAESDKDPEAETSLRLGYVEDVINLIYAVKNSKFDYLSKEKFGMLGHSMGGGVAINTMVVKPDLVKAFVLYAAVSSYAPDNFERWITRRPEIAKKVIELYGSPQESPEFWKNISAVNFFERIKSPVLIFHGTNDADVPYDWSTALETKLEEANKQAELVTFQGEGHEFGPKWTSFMQQTTSFFNNHLK